MLTLFGWYHLIAFGVVIPILAIRTRRHVESRPLPPRRKHFVSTLGTLLVLGAFSAYAAHVQHIAIFPAALPHLPGAIAGAVMLAACVGFMRPRWPRAVERRSRLVHLFMPRDRRERMLWLGLAAVAGVSEEITWRGVQPVLLTIVIARPMVAAVLIAVTFGIGHMVQGWRSAAIVTLFALAFQCVVWLSGSLYVAMAVHFLYDAAAGLTYGRLGEELGYPVDGITLPDASAPA